VLGRIQHHFNHALDLTVGRREAADVDSKPARNGGAHLISIQLLPLDLTRFKDILGQGVQSRFRSK
jgi:hypothetical protein